MLQINSFYGNVHSAPTPERERLFDKFRSVAMDARLTFFDANRDPIFYTPELRAVDYTDQKNPIDGALQITIESDKDGLWAVKLQHKRYTTVSDGIILVSERTLEDGLSSEKAFDVALTKYSAIKWNYKARQNLTDGNNYYYAPRERYKTPILTTKTETAMFMPVAQFPLYAAKVLGNERLLQRRDEVLGLVKAGHQTLEAA